jgi:hypothetical protein
MDGLSLAAKSIRPRVGAIGTCRIFSPLHYLERNTRIIAVKDPLKWYTHSIPEAIQKIRIIRGEVTIPSNLVPFIVYEVDRFDPGLYRPGYYEAAEVFVIEVSAINTVQWRNVELQRWCMRDAFQAAGIDYSRLLRLLNAGTVFLRRDRRDLLRSASRHPRLWDLRGAHGQQSLRDAVLGRAQGSAARRHHGAARGQDVTELQRPVGWLPSVPKLCLTAPPP